MSDIICSKCNQPKPEEEFHIQRCGAKYPYRLSYCDDCRRSQIAIRLYSSWETFIGDRVHRTRARSKKLGLQFDLTTSGLIQQLKRQEFRCFYTDVPLVHTKCDSKRDALSLDRVDCGIGYVTNNVVLCTSRANTTKSDMTLMEFCAWMPGWYERARKFLNKT